MKGFVQNIEILATENEDFRRVLYTAKSCQLVLMSLKPQEEIGAEVHHLDQFFRVESGTGEAIFTRHQITGMASFIIPFTKRDPTTNTMMAKPRNESWFRMAVFTFKTERC